MIVATAHKAESATSSAAYRLREQRPGGAVPRQGAAAEVLDFSRPVAVMLVAILQHIGDEDDPFGIVGQLMAAVPAGSYLAISHPASDIEAGAMAEIAERMNEMVAEKVTFRNRAQTLRFFDGLDLEGGETPMTAVTVELLTHPPEPTGVTENDTLPVLAPDAVEFVADTDTLLTMCACSASSDQPY